MALRKSSGDLADAITSVLKAANGPESCKITVEEVDDNGNKSTKTFALGGGDGTISFSTLPDPKLNTLGVSGNNVTGVEALASVIADKVLTHILENFELAAGPRYDALETDFNTFLTILTPVVAGLQVTPFSGPGVAAALFGASMAVGGPAREAKTATFKAQEKSITKGGELL